MDKDILLKAILSRRQNIRSKSAFPPIGWWQQKILKHQNKISEKKVSIGALQFKYRSPYEFMHSYDEIFVQELYRFNTAAQQPLIVDCGANIGISVLYLKKLHPASTIHAFEPDAINLDLLQKNIALNTLTDVIVHNAAVWTHDRGVRFKSNNSQDSRITEHEGEVVKSVDLSVFLSQFLSIDLLKIDIEGAEYEVLKHISPQLSHVKNLFVEYHGNFDEGQKLLDILQMIHQTHDIQILQADNTKPPPFMQVGGAGIFDVQLNIFGISRL